MSLRRRGEQPSFNVLKLQRPEIVLSRMVWDAAGGGFVETAAGRYRHTASGWAGA